VGGLPTAVGAGTPLGSARTTLLASLSVSQSAPSPSAIPAGLAFGLSCDPTAPVVAFRWVRRPVDGATHTELPCAAIAPVPLGTTLPILTGRPSASNSGSTRPTNTLLVPEIGRAS